MGASEVDTAHVHGILCVCCACNVYTYVCVHMRVLYFFVFLFVCSFVCFNAYLFIYLFLVLQI